MAARALRTRLSDRVIAFQRTENRRLLFGADADAELAEAARTTATTRLPVTGRGRRRLAQLYHAAAWLHFHRYDRSPGDEGFADLARAVFYLGPLMGNDALIPVPLLPVLGGRTDPRAQLGLAQELLSRARTEENGPYTVSVMALLDAAAAQATDPEHRAELTSLLGVAHRQRAHAAAIADPTDLERAVTLSRTAVDAVGPDSESRSKLLERLGLALLTCHQFGARPADAAGAVSALEESVRTARPTDPALAPRRGNLALALRTRHELDGNAADLERALAVLAEALRPEPPSEPAQVAFLYEELRVALLQRCVLFGRPEDISRAVTAGELSLAATPLGTGERVGALGALAETLLWRYEYEGRSTDLDRAVGLAEETLSLSSRPADRPSVALRLGHCLLSRCGRAEEASDVQRAVALMEEAAAALPCGSALYQEAVSGLAQAYHMRYGLLRRTPDLDRAVAAAEEAVRAGGPGPRAIAKARSNLASVLLSRYRRLRRPGDLDGAVEHGVAALRGLAPRSAEALTTVAVAASALTERTDAGLRTTDRDHVAFLLDREWGPPAPSRARIQSLQEVGGLALAAGRHARAAQLLDEAALMLPYAVPDSTNPIDLVLPLTTHLGLAENAIEAHCARSDPASALASAELVRGLLAAGGTSAPRRPPGLPSPAEAERAAAARRFTSIRQALSAARPPGQARPYDAPRAYAAYEEACAAVREGHGLARFLLPQDVSVLRPGGGPGAVVVVSAGRRTGHAVIIGPSREPVALPLPELTGAAASEHTGLFALATGQVRADPHARLADALPLMLDWLWTAVGEPVTTRVRELVPEPRPRLWWIPVGLVSVLPLHAAAPIGGAGCLDAVVSSYAPSVRASDGVGRPGRTGPRRQLAVAVSSSPGLPELPGALREARELAARGATVLPDASRAEVMAALPAASRVHFACHAGIDPLSPSEGALHLADGPLTIAEVAALDLAGAELAYLSACSTGQGGWRYAGEALHVASAFRQAGFRHVIGSLWPVADPVAVRFARRFYEELPPEDSEGSAEALNRAARWMRDRSPARPDQWAALVHSGP
ncbi:CHAT domain-containing protein [Streptomyces sindenensis]|uniref:CHAT domain-containing protein n=1 Tax=Streptomyces sindenensis TaxID=67363 RepID=A0ABW6EI61_9ACTN